MKIFRNISRKKGFALVESLVAILILSAVSATMFQVLAGSTLTINGVRDELIMYQLANEGIEQVHNAKDSAYDAWVAGTVSGDKPQWGFGSSLGSQFPLVPEFASKFSRNFEIEGDLTTDTKINLSVTVSLNGTTRSVRTNSILFR
jgi:prepilin-type N-terminal cleavage/methylation domain-containing protein